MVSDANPESSALGTVQDNARRCHDNAIYLVCLRQSTHGFRKDCSKPSWSCYNVAIGSDLSVSWRYSGSGPRSGAYYDGTIVLEHRQHFPCTPRLGGSPALSGARRFRRRAIWLWMMEEAAERDHRDQDLIQGQLRVSVRILAEEFCWKEKAVRHFLKQLEAAGLIKQSKERHSRLITINNYASIQGFCQ